MYNGIIGNIFNRQAIISIDLSSFFPELSSLLNGNILYEDHHSREYFIPISKNEAESSDIIMKIKKYGIRYEQIGDIIWIRTMEIHRYNEALNESLKSTKRLDEIDGVVMYPPSPIMNGRIYHLIHYRESHSQAVTDRLIDLFINYDNIVGHGSFRIEEITGKIVSVDEFIKKYAPRARLVNIGVEMGGISASFIGIISYPSLQVENLGFLLKMNDELINIKLGTLESIMGSNSFSPRRVFEEGRNLMSLPAYMEASCNGESCISNFIMEEKLVPFAYKVISKMLGLGFKIRIIRFEML